ncbi:MAG: serine/threonine protein kinase [Deltaproteobacteria bacterium]|nr:serine/threonine protein kinase [Deltaproteobacteria bacterium]
MELLKENQIIRGTYEVERLLGVGAFAEVYRVKHRFLGRQAIKIFKSIGMTMEEIKVLMGEAIILSRMGHPNIIRLFDADVIETSWGTCGFFTMEYVAGGSLEQFWRSYGAQLVPVETTVDIIKQVCRGLSIAHCENPPIIHRDIKPANILVGYDADGLRVRLSDFGLAKKVNPLTFLASARGTLAFKAPEAFSKQGVDSSAGDVWSIGMTLYLLLTDRLPYSTSEEIDMDDVAHFDRPLIPPSRFNVMVDPLLDQIVFRALNQDPEKRYANARKMLKDMVRWKPQSIECQLKMKGLSETTKSVLGLHTGPNEEKAREMVKQAREMVREGLKFNEAADIMEEAFNKWPVLRDEYGYQIKLWRRGISM